MTEEKYSSPNFVLTKDGSTALVYSTGEVYEVTMTPEALEYFSTPGCECGMVPILGLDEVIVSGRDDCPAHGLGAK
jgi:hypothetical protein